MADLSDVEQALLGVIELAVYPDGVDQPSVVANPVRIFRGWPNPLGLNSDLTSGVATVTIFSDPLKGRETTRYPRAWIPGPVVPPTLTMNVSGSNVLIGGTTGAGQVAGILVDGAAFAVAVSASDTPSSIASSLAISMPGATATGSIVTIPGASSISARIEGSGTATMELRRQEQTVTVSVWCNEPMLRDALSGAVDSALAGIDWLPFADGSAGQLRYGHTVETDTSENANLYRRDLLYCVEYPTIRTMTAPAMMFGVVADASVSVASVPSDALIGAIRFDAWYAPTDTVDTQCAAALADASWSYRWPPNATETGGILGWPLATQGVMDAEIEAALAAGLNFWAFDSYAPLDGLSTALSLFLASTKRSALAFCMLGQISNWADPTTSDGYSAALDRDVGLMSQPGYLTVTAQGRPVYLVLDASAAQMATLPTGPAGAIAAVRAKAAAASLPNPFIVWLSGAPLIEYDNTVVARAVGADAAAAYSCPGGPTGATSYGTLTALANADWAARALTGLPMLPTAMTGWDPRPLIENPQPFYPISSSASASDYYVTADLPTLGAHVAALAEFVTAHPDACAAGLGLVYAWNELAEGGWLMPTYGAGGPDTSRIEAVGAALAAWRRQQTATGTTIV